MSIKVSHIFSTGCVATVLQLVTGLEVIHYLRGNLGVYEVMKGIEISHQKSTVLCSPSHFNEVYQFTNFSVSDTSHKLNGLPGKLHYYNKLSRPPLMAKCMPGVFIIYYN